LFALLISWHSQSSSIDAPVEFSSGQHQVAMLELFTSEGCSSCPPADRWLSNLKNDPGLWSNFNPIAFHVDYWDYIGWTDRFAQSQFSDRQRRYADEGGARVVYTPGFFVNGTDWRGWRTGETIASANNEVGDLAVSITGRDVVAQFDSQNDKHEDLVFHIAVLGMNLETKVAAGENTGKTLHHDFVALSVVSVPLENTTTGYKATTRIANANSVAKDRAIVAWVTDNKRQTPIQSVGGLLPNH